MRTLEDRLTQASDEARLQVSRIDTRSATSIRSRQQRSRTFVGTVAVAAMFIVFGATAFVMSTQTGQDSASEPSAPPTTAALVAVAEASAPLPAASDITHLVGNITSSSELSAEFGATKLIDGDLERGWHDASLRGVGAEIILEFTEPVAITEIVMHPYADEERFARNYWVQTYDIRTNDLGPTITGRLANFPEPQVVRMGTNETLTLTFSVTTAYPALPYGDDPPFDELAIAEIQVFGTPISGTTESTAALTTTSIVVDDATAASTTTSIASAGAVDAPDALESPDIVITEGQPVWDTLIANVESGAVPVELRGQLLGVHNDIFEGLGGVPLQYTSGYADPGLHEAAFFLYNAGSSDLVIGVQWQEWDGRSESNPLGFQASALREQWGSDSVFIDIQSDFADFGAINTGSLKTVKFLRLSMEYDLVPTTISEAQMREIAQAVFEALRP